MSIYGTILFFDQWHEDGCAVWVEDPPGSNSYRLGERACTCGLPGSPYVYEGSHVLPSATDRKGGSLDLAMVPAHITRDGRDDGAEGPKDWLRLSLTNQASTEQYEGKPYVPAGASTIVLNRRHAEELRDALTDWLEREEDW